jgi:outer membrane protein TolC
VPSTPTLPTIAHRLFFALIIFALAITLPGCATNSKPVKSTAPLPFVSPQVTSPSIPTSTLQRLDTKLNIQFDWWKLLHSAQLNTLIEQTFSTHSDVESAQAALLATQQIDSLRTGFFQHTVTVVGAVNTQERPALGVITALPAEAKFIGAAYFDLRTSQFSTGYLPELLRPRERATSAAIEDAELRRLHLEATYLTISTNLIACVIDEASLRAQMIAARKIAAIDQSLLAIARKRLKAGLVTQAQFAAQQKSTELSGQALLTLKDQFEQTRGLLRTLLGLSPDGVMPELLDLASLHLPTELPLELPAVLIQQRPDVRAAQLELQITTVNYQNAVEIAAKNIQDIAQAIYNAGINLNTAAASEQDYLQMLASLRRHESAHNTKYQEVLVAEQNVQLAALRLAQARALYLGNAVALYHALGGAWWNDAVTLREANELTKH